MLLGPQCCISEPYMHAKWFISKEVDGILEKLEKKDDGPILLWQANSLEHGAGMVPVLNGGFHDQG